MRGLIEVMKSLMNKYSATDTPLGLLRLKT